MDYTATFEMPSGKIYEKTFNCPSLEDATIEADQWAEDNKHEFLQIVEG